VIGLGNPLMGDDAFGPRVIERLRRETPDSLRYADLADAHTDLLTQIARFPAYRRVVLVDAVIYPQECAGSAGNIVVLDEETIQAWPETSPSVHQLSPLLAIKLFRCLNPHAATQILLLGLCTNGAELGSGMGAKSGALSEETVAAGVEKARELL